MNTHIMHLIVGVLVIGILVAASQASLLSSFLGSINIQSAAQQFLQRVVPNAVQKDVVSVEQTAKDATTIYQYIDTSGLPDAARLELELSKAENAYILAVAAGTGLKIGDVIIQEMLTGHIDVAADERNAVLTARAAIEAFLAAPTTPIVSG